MKKLTVFYLDNCPYCRKAKEAEKEIISSDPSLQKVEIEWIEESLNPAIADTYDYYRVPSVFLSDTKLYECSPKDDYDTIKSNFEKAMKIAAAQ
jgi:glutaredoxin